MYRCEICSGVSPSGKPLSRWVIHRKDGQISRELRICGECHDDLQSGVSLQLMIEEHHRPAVPIGPFLRRMVPTLLANQKPTRPNPETRPNSSEKK